MAPANRAGRTSVRPTGSRLTTARNSIARLDELQPATSAFFASTAVRHSPSGIRHGTTDSQTLTLNWPNRKKRASVAVQHLCTAHANSGYIVLGHLQFDPAGDMEQVENDMALNGDIKKARCMRRHGRLWTTAEFKKYLDDITAKVILDPEIAADIDLGL